MRKLIRADIRREKRIDDLIDGRVLARTREEMLIVARAEDDFGDDFS